jgi:hypothetical protein
MSGRDYIIRDHFIYMQECRREFGARDAGWRIHEISFEGVIYEALLPDTDGFHAFFIVGVVFVAQPPSQILQDRRLACTTTADESRVLRIQV